MTSRALQAAFLFLASIAFPLGARANDGPTVLCYHIVESPADPRMEISREQFRQQMRYLAATGYNVIPLRQAYDYAVGKRASLPPRSVVITFDDGWRSTYTEVFPEMKRRRFPFTIFIYPNIVGKTSHALTWKQVKEMSEWGADIESHSFSHPFLTRRRHASLDDAQYTAWLDRELAGSRRLLERETGRPVEFLAYPYGDYDRRLAAAVGRSGYLGALTCEYGRIQRGSDPLRMRRFVIEKRMDFASFRHYMGATPMPLRAVAPLPSLPVDAGPIPLTVSAKIPNYKSVDPKSVGLALMSAAGAAVPFAYDPKDGSITVTIKEALKGIQRAIVWATDLKSGKRLEAQWVFKIPEPAPPPAAVPASAPLPPPCAPSDPTCIAASPAAPAPATAPATTAPAVTVPVSGGSGGGSHAADLRLPLQRAPKP